MTEGKEIAEKAIYRVHIDAPIEQVWSQLVKTDEVLPFFFGAVCNTDNGLEVGSKIAMRTKDNKYTSVVGEILEFEPPYRYSHTLKFTNLEDPYSTVTYLLEEKDGGVEFSLITTNVPAGSKTEKSMAQGSPFIINTIKALCETGKPTLSGRMMLGMISLMTPFTPKVCLSENWPYEKI